MLVKMGIHSFQIVGYTLDTSLRGYDDFSLFIFS